MDSNFKLEIISPEKIIFSDNTTMVTLPSYEGDMSLLKKHISIISFLRPGIIKVQKNDGNFEEFFATKQRLSTFKIICYLEGCIWYWNTIYLVFLSFPLSGNALTVSGKNSTKAVSHLAFPEENCTLA